MNNTKSIHNTHFISFKNLMLDFYGFPEDVLNMFQGIPTITHNNEIYVSKQTVYEVYTSFKVINNSRPDLSNPITFPNPHLFEKLL